MINVADDGRFLDRLACTMAVVLPNGRTLGMEMSELKFNTYIQYFSGRGTNYLTNLSSIARLIIQCPNLIRLHLRMIRIDHKGHSLTADQIETGIQQMQTYRQAGLVQALEVAGVQIQTIQKVDAVLRLT